MIPAEKLNEIMSNLVESLKTNPFERDESLGSWIQHLIPELCLQQAIWSLKATEDFLQALLQSALKLPNKAGKLNRQLINPFCGNFFSF